MWHTYCHASLHAGLLDDRHSQLMAKSKRLTAFGVSQSYADRSLTHDRPFHAA